MKKLLRYSGVAAFLPLLLSSGAVWAKNPFLVLMPAGAVAGAENRLLLIDVGIMMLVILPTIFLAALFLRRYRASNTKAKYHPKWEYSIPLELTLWGVPLLVVAVLAYFAFTGIYAVNPYNPGVLKGATRGKPVNIDVIALDWKWLFIYPNKHIASVDTLDIPVHRPVHFRLTSATVTNDFFIPQLNGQIYAMPGMRTKDQLVAGRKGTYTGFSAQQSGAGFSWMRFTAKAVSEKKFRSWVHKVKQAPVKLNQTEFKHLAQPVIDIGHRARFYSHVKPGLFNHLIEQVKAGKVFRTPLFAGKDMSDMGQSRD